MDKKWLVPFGILIVAALSAVFVPQAPAHNPNGPINPGDTAWLLTASALVLLMTPGLSFFYGGMVRTKNVISTMLQSIIAMGLVSIVWVVVGFSIAFGDSIGGTGTGLIGNPLTFFMFRGVTGATHADLAPTIPLVLFAIFQMKFAIITPALVTGAFAERVRFTSYLLFLVLFSIFIYSPLAHWTWHPNGFLRNLGVLDFAGGTVVHMSAGFAALAGALLLGKRKDYGNGSSHAPANIPFVILGTGMLWFGWFGFNAGSALAANEIASVAFINTNTASAAAMLAWIFFDGLRGRKPTALGASIAAVVGLVAITPAAGYVSVGASLFIGVSSSLVSNLAVAWRSKTQVDDTLDVFPCHGVGGMSGMVLTGIFASTAVNSGGADGLLYGGWKLFAHHMLALVFVAGFTFTGAYLLFKLTNWVTPLRVSEEHEHEGLDWSQHGETIELAGFSLAESDCE